MHPTYLPTNQTNEPTNESMNMSPCFYTLAPLLLCAKADSHQDSAGQLNTRTHD